jgi:hypothetical protein
LFSQLSLQQTSSVHGDKGDGKHQKKVKNMVCTLSCCISIFIFLALAILFFIPFLCTQEHQRAPSLPISPICGDGDAATNPISGGDVLVSEADQQGHDMCTRVFLGASSIFLQIVADTDV